MAIDPTPYYEDLPLANGPDTETSGLALIPFYKIEVGTTGAYLVKGLIPREGLIVIWGPPKCGKSFWTFDLAMHIALGWRYRGRRIVQGPVVYVACEGAHGFRARIEAFRCRHLQEHVGDVPFYLVPARLALVEDHEEQESVQRYDDDRRSSAVGLETAPPPRRVEGPQHGKEVVEVQTCSRGPPGQLGGAPSRFVQGDAVAP